MWEGTLKPNAQPWTILPPQQEMVARSTDDLDTSATRSVGSTANLKGKMSKRLSVVKGHFPKLVDCAHFHYEHVDFGSLELQVAVEQSDVSAKDLVFLVQVSCQGKTWMVRRSYEEFRTLDAHLHQCIYDRRYSRLLALPALSELEDRAEVFSQMLSEYLSRFSSIADNKLNCGPVLTWMEIDNHGNRFLLKEEASLNVPAIAAAHVVKRYTAQASDEISIEVGDILSVIDMPPREDTTWWRGKHGFQVGFFPSECVELINEKKPPSVGAAAEGDPMISSTTEPSSPTSVSKKHGKLMGFLRTFMKSRPSKQKLKQRGILKERVFGCDLGEHLLNSGLDVPQVLKSCSEFIEKHGVVDGIYRHSGVSSNIQKLRHEFDSENVPDLTKDVYMQDIHCVGSLCKLYFRELPNPLLTYQLYDKFAECMGEMTEDERMVKVHDVIQQLPPPHYRTLEFLIRHLARLATSSTETNMHVKNLAIVWAPNLLRSKEIEAAGLSGADPFREVRIQSVVVEFLLSNVDVLFSDSFTSVGRFCAATGGAEHKILSSTRTRLVSLQEARDARQSLTRPKSFVSTRLLSLEEAQARTQAPLLLLQGAPHAIGRFHTVLDLPADKRKRGIKVRKSAGSWKTFFAIGKPVASGRRKPTRITSLFQPSTSHAGCRVDSVTLRSAKSEESLSSQHSSAGQGQGPRLRRPLSSSDGLSLAASNESNLLPQQSLSRINPSRSYDSLLPQETRDADEEDEEDEEGVYMLPDFSQEPTTSWIGEDVIDFSPTFQDDGPIVLGSTSVPPGGGRESPPAAAPPPYRFLSHQEHTRTGSQRSVTDDPDSVLNQTEVAARRSLILAAAASPQQVFCQHRPTGVTNPPAKQSMPKTSPSHSQTPVTAIAPAQERRSFTRKVVHALSPKAPKSPPLDISDPISISVPAKVLEMIGGRAGELQPGPPGVGPTQPPQMISMLLRSCDFQLTQSCQEELSSKLGPIAKIKGPSISGSTRVSLNSQPPPPPPKNPARLMALALAESANKALRQGASPPYRPRQSGCADVDTRFQRSFSADAGALLSSDPNQIYSTVRPLSVWRAESDDNVVDEDDDEDDDRTSTKNPVDKSHDLEPSFQAKQNTGTLSSDSSVSDSATSNSELSAASSSEDNERSPIPIYTNEDSSLPQPSQTSPTSCSDAAPQRKPPAYGRQFSAPQLQHDSKSSCLSQPPNLQQNPLLHSKSESSPLALVQAFQPSRPKVPPKPPDLAPFRASLSQTDRHDHMRRSLDASRIRRLMGPAQASSPLTRAFSERISSTSNALSRYHAARMASQAAQLPQQSTQSSQIRSVVSSSEDQSKMENLYYEIGAPEHPQLPPSYARHSYQTMKLDVEGNFRLTDQGNQRPASRSQPPPYTGHGTGSGRAQFWPSEATRAWAHSHSISLSQSHRSQDRSGHAFHARPQRQSSSVRLSRSELHPLPLGSSVGMVPLSVHQRNLHRSQRLPSEDQSASQLHPYFENGKVCYRYTETSQQELNQPTSLKASQIQQGSKKLQSEPIYVNYPFNTASESGMNPKGWTTTDLDRGGLVSETELLLSEVTLSEKLSPTTFNNPDEKELSADSKAVMLAGASSSSMHLRNHSDPQNTSFEQPPHVLTGKEIASLLIEKLAVDEQDASLESLPHLEHPPNPYPTQVQQPPPPAYNVYTPGPSRGQLEGQAPGRAEEQGVFHRQDFLRRSSGGQYRQAFDVMPSGDQVLKFHRSQDLCTGAQPEGTMYNPYLPRLNYQNPMYPSLGPRGLPDSAHTCTPPTVAFSNFGSTRPYGGQVTANMSNQYPYQSRPMLPPYPNTPLREAALDPSLCPLGTQSERGLNRQGNLSGPNWTIRTEGQTRSYC